MAPRKKSIQTPPTSGDLMQYGLTLALAYLADDASKVKNLLKTMPAYHVPYLVNFIRWVSIIVESEIIK